MSDLTYVCDHRRHLVCLPFSIKNLHRMAAEIGIGQHFYHGGRFPHYDIPALRVGEIITKCVQVSGKDIVRIIAGELTDVPE